MGLLDTNSSCLLSGNEIYSVYQCGNLEAIKVKRETGLYLDSGGVTKCFVGIFASLFTQAKLAIVIQLYSLEKFNWRPKKSPESS